MSPLLLYHVSCRCHIFVSATFRLVSWAAHTGLSDSHALAHGESTGGPKMLASTKDGKRISFADVQDMYRPSSFCSRSQSICRSGVRVHNELAQRSRGWRKLWPTRRREGSWGRRYRRSSARRGEARRSKQTNKALNRRDEERECNNEWQCNAASKTQRLNQREEGKQDRMREAPSEMS